MTIILIRQPAIEHIQSRPYFRPSNSEYAMLLSIIYIIGITAEAMTGALSAGRKNMDWFGVMLVASATAIGGGSVRDIILGNYPLIWVQHPQYLLISLRGRYPHNVACQMGSQIQRHLYSPRCFRPSCF